MGFFGDLQGSMIVAGRNKLPATQAKRFHSLWHAADRVVLKARLGRLGGHTDSFGLSERIVTQTLCANKLFVVVSGI